MFTRRRLLVVGALVLAGTYLGAGGLGLPALDPAPVDGNTPTEDQVVQPVENGSYLWPYTARAKTTDKRGLATNVIIVGEDRRVRRVLTQETNLNWQLSNETADNEAVNDSAADDFEPPTPIPDNDTNATVDNKTDAQPVIIERRGLGWDDTHGAIRYSYIDARPAGGDAGWVREAYQIHAGEYFGSRSHIRAYTTPATEWTAIQIHREYFDWFRLRHTVTGIQPSRNALESNFLEKPFVQEVSREYHAVNHGWNDGWLSEIHIAPGAGLLLLVMALFTRETHQSLRQEGKRALSWLRQNVRGFVLVAGLVTVVLGVRSAGIVFETAFPDLTPKVAFGPLYTVLALGPPLLAFIFAQPLGATSRFTRLQHLAKRFGPPLEALPAFAFAFIGLTTAFVLDFGGLGVSRIPVQLVLNRVGLACALGLIAAGSTRIDEHGAGLLAIGILGWVVGLGMPLLGYV